MVVLTDPPGVAVPSDGALSRALKSLDKSIVKLALSRVDGVVALTQALADDFSPGVPAVVVSGFMDRALEGLQFPDVDRDRSTFRVAYAGGLSSEYGVERLLDAVLGIESRSVSLVLFGKGPLLERIKACAVSDPRIVYGGALPPRELHPILQSMDLLINPRPSSQGFVRHSFPSKIIEYMALGVPVATTRLPGISSDFLEKMYVLDNESSVGIRAAILRISSLSKSDRLSKAKSARDFVSLAASEVAQGVRIVKFIKTLF